MSVLLVLGDQQTSDRSFRHCPIFGGQLTLPIQCGAVRQHRNLLGHAPKHMHDELPEDDRDMIYADTAADIEKRRKAFSRKLHLKCRAVADSLEEAGDRLFTFTRIDPSQRTSARTTNAIERLNEEFRRRIKTQTVLPCSDTVPMLLRALMASGQIHPLGIMLGNRLPGNGCERSMVGKPWLSLSPQSALTSRPDQAHINMLGERRQRISTSVKTQPAFIRLINKPVRQVEGGVSYKVSPPPYPSLESVNTGWLPGLPCFAEK